MRFAKAIFLSVVTVAVMAYALDCGAWATPDQAKQCCNSMPCSPHGHDNGMKCCTNMPSMHDDFLQPTSAQNLSKLPMVFAVLSVISESDAAHESEGAVAANCHAPPIFGPPAVLPLRI
jgi:hypothetical protein